MEQQSPKKQVKPSLRLYNQLLQQQAVSQDQPLPESIISIDNRNIFLCEDLPLPFQRKFTVTGICSIVFGLLLIGFEGGQLANGDDFSNGGTFISGAFSFYAGILFLVLCRQQIYALKSLLALIIIQLLMLLPILMFSCFIVASTHKFQCRPTDYPPEQGIQACETARTLAILAIIAQLLLLASTIFNLVITIREWRARRRAGHGSNIYIFSNIPLSLRKNFKKTGIAYIVLGLSMMGLDIGLLLSNYPFSFYTGFISGLFSIVYAVVLTILSSKRIYVLTSLFSLALAELIVLLLTFIMICIGFNAFRCSIQILPFVGICETAKSIAVVLLIAVGLSITMTVLNMVFIMRGRREQQHVKLPPTPMVSAYINPINGKN